MATAVTRRGTTHEQRNREPLVDRYRPALRGHITGAGRREPGIARQHLEPGGGLPLAPALFERQTGILKDQACSEYLAGLKTLGLNAQGIPDFDLMNKNLRPATGWEVVAVPGLIPSKPFFTMLANRQFPAGNFIRKPEELDYLEEPDIFHDVFGHVPLLTNPAYASYMQEYGRAGDAAIANKGVKYLARLNWYTIEFGLIRNGGDVKIYGAGIVSSFGEAR